MIEDSRAGAQRLHSCRCSGQFTLLDWSPDRMDAPSQPPAHQQRCPEPEKLQDRVCDGGGPKTMTRKMTDRFVGGGRRLSTISEREPDKMDTDPGSHDPLGGSSISICSSKLNNSSSCLSSDDSYLPVSGDDCATLLLACLHCHFHELMVLLPITCERAVQRCFPSYKYIMESGDMREQQERDWCSYKLELDCDCCGSCQDAGELIELAMEISERPDRGGTRRLAARHSGSMLSFKSKFNLVQVRGTWIRQTEENQQVEGRLSEAKIFENKCDHGVSWTVVSPIVFTYRVVQCKNLLDPSNGTLLWGHLEDEALESTISSIRPVKRFVVIDQTVNQLYGARVAKYFQDREVVYKILPLHTTEENKCLDLVTKILEEVHEFDIDRRSEPIIAVGGGVCLDVVGLAASLYRRRSPYIRVPTTLLSYVDASVGAKTGVNFAGGKNKLGSYVPPVATFLDRSFFQTLPPRQISNGMAEMLKMALMKHRGLFELLEADGRQLLRSKLQSSESHSSSEREDSATASTRIAIETMLEELAPNLWEDDLDRLVDFGHLISPKLEMTVLPALLHGEAVNVDMSFMVYVAHQRGLLTAHEKNRIIQCMLGLGLPVWHQDCTLDLVQRSLVERRSHCAGSLRMPLPTGLGCAEIFHDTIEDNILCQVHQNWTDELSCAGNK